MPIYEYRCADNDAFIEVSHPMGETLATWGELCARAGHPLGETARDTPVEKVIPVPIAHTSEASKGPPPGGCGPSCGCVGH